MVNKSLEEERTVVEPPDTHPTKVSFVQEEDTPASGISAVLASGPPVIQVFRSLG